MTKYHVETVDSEVEVEAKGFEVYTDGRVEFYTEDEAGVRRVVFMANAGVWRTVADQSAKKG